MARDFDINLYFIHIKCVVWLEVTFSGNITERHITGHIFGKRLNFVIHSVAH